MGFTEEKLQTDKYTCPNCGGACEFDPKKQMLTCQYCNSKIEIDKQIFNQEQDIETLFKEAKVWDETEIIQCQNCGAKESVNKGGLSTSCPFCGTTNIVKTTEIVGMKPHGLCTFEITSEQAADLAKKWAKSKKFAPNKFKKSVEAKAIKGVYSPAFTFDCSTNTKYRGVLGERRSRRVIRNGKRTTETYISYFPISGTHSTAFDDVIVHASANIPDVMLDKLGAYPTSQASEYDQKFLVGYTANTYNKDGAKAWIDGKQKIDSSIKRQVLAKYDHDVVDSFVANTVYTDRSFKYLLLPVYVGHYIFKDKNYNFFVNGSTGQVAGKTPISVIKVLFAIFGGLILATILVLLFSHFR